MSSESRPIEMTVLFTVRSSFSIIICTCRCVGPLRQKNKTQQISLITKATQPCLLLKLAFSHKICFTLSKKHYPGSFSKNLNC